MNKHFTQNPLRFLLLVVIAFSSGCAQSSITNSPQSIITNSAEPSLTPILAIANETPTFMPCLLPPQATPSEFVKTSDEWFQSSQPSITSRSNYNSSDTERIWNGFCEHYQTAISNQELWPTSPIEIAMRLAGYPNDDYWYPDTVTAHYRKHSPYIVTVIIVVTGLLDDSVGASDIRVDLVFTEEKWHIQWFGFRQLCIRDNIDGWVTKLCP